MKKWYEEEKYSDKILGHIWIIHADRPITEDEHDEWLADAIAEREMIRQGKCI